MRKVLKFHEEEGYEVVKVRSGQTRSYGPSIDEYHVKDLTGKRTKGEIRDYCTSKVRRADDPMQNPLRMHLKSFSLRDDGYYRYVCGHDYTG